VLLGEPPMPEVNQSHFYEYDIRHIGVMCSINVSLSSIHRVWIESPLSVTGLFLSFSFFPPSLSGSRGKRSDQGGGELVFGPKDPWTQILSLFHSCHSAPPSLSLHQLYSAAILTLRASPATPPL